MTDVSVTSFVAVILSLLVLGCADSKPGNPEIEAPPDHLGKVLQWEVISTSPPRTLKVGGESGYCVGYSRPAVTPPQIRYKGENVYIRLETVAKREPSKGEICGGVGLFLQRVIVLRKDLADVRIYDAGVNPPELRWPTERR